jgi:hypothetical protein
MLHYVSVRHWTSAIQYAKDSATKARKIGVTSCFRGSSGNAVKIG